MTPSGGDQLTRSAEKALAFQAIGHYVYEFSWLCWDMKYSLTSVPHLTGSAYTTIQLVTGEMTAAPLANACFAVCENAVQDDSPAIKMIRALRTRVLEEITRRNDLLHGDWMIGWISSTGVELPDGGVEQVVRDRPPTLSRLKPGRSGAEKRTEEEITVAELEDEAIRVRDLRHTVEDFLRVLEGRALTVPGMEPVSLHDVYVLTKNGLARTGPRAAEVPPWKMH